MTDLLTDLLPFATGAAFGMFATAGTLAYRVLKDAQAARKDTRK